MQLSHPFITGALLERRALTCHNSVMIDNALRLQVLALESSVSAHARACWQPNACWQSPKPL